MMESLTSMCPEEDTVWREALDRLRELEEEVGRVEAVVRGRCAAAGVAQSAPPPSEPPRRGEAEPALTLGNAPRLATDLRRQLGGDPLQALALVYPPEAFEPGVAPERARRACLLHHALNTARLAMYVVLRHGFQPSAVEVIGVCALLHDVGLERVPAELFTKPGPLTAGERATFEAHAVEGADRLRRRSELDGLLRAIVPAVVRQHHERTDGSGYPDGLDAPHIHEFARLLALAEAYETMVSARPYKPARLPHDAMATLLMEAFGKGGPARFDRRLAASFLRALSLYPIGSGVRLETGEVGLVVGANPRAPDRPHVRVLWTCDGLRVARPRVIDLAETGIAVAQAVPLP